MMAVLEIEEATNLAHKMVVYIESEQRDLKVDEDKFDALWQSIYDVCMLVHFNILDELLSEDEYLEGVTWLKDYQHLTKDYQDKELELWKDKE